VNRAALLVAAASFGFGARASAADAVVELTLDGRPVDRHAGSAILHHGFVFADAIDLTKCFDGFITLLPGGAATITIGPNTGTFRPGLRRATINAMLVALPAAPFIHDGDLFVPLEPFIKDIAAASVRFTGRHHADIRVETRGIR
jgi:hypothetical protein